MSIRLPVEHRARTTLLLLATLCVAMAVWLPRGFTLDRFVTADEHAWLARSGNFYYALAHRDWAGTFQREHPGVTVTWAGLAGFLWRAPAYAQEAPGQFGWLTEEIEPYLRSQGHDPVDLIAAGRTVIVLVITLCLLLSFLLATRLFGLGAALAGFGLIAFDPFHVAHSRLLHLDGLVSTFMLLAVLAFLVYLTTGSLHTLLLSAVAAGLACLTRSPAFFLGPFVALLVAVMLLRSMNLRRVDDALQRNRVMSYLPGSLKLPGRFTGFITQRPSTDGGERQIWDHWTAGKLLVALLIWSVTTGLVFVLLWPAMWTDPVGSLRQVLNAAGEYAAEGHLKPTFYAGQVYAGDPGFSFYPVTYLWRTTPIVLLGLLLAVIAFLWGQAPFATPTARGAALALAGYAVLFMLFMNIGAKKFDRYILPSYPALDLLAGAGWIALASVLYTRLSGTTASETIHRIAIIGTPLLAITIQAALALPTFPYYLSYYNPLLGGSAKAPEVMMIGWGEGADQAARYLSMLPEAQGPEGLPTVASGYTNGPFSYFYPHQTLPIYFWHAADYAVVYAQDWQRLLPARAAIEYYHTQTPLHIVRINGLEYAHIFDLHQMPLPPYVIDWGPESEIQGQQGDTRLSARPSIRLVTFQLPAAPISPGDSFRAIFYLVNQAPIATNLNVVVRIVGADGEEVARSEGWPWGAPTSTWQTDQVWPDGHDFSIPATTAPGYYKVELGFYDPATGELWPGIRAATGEVLGDYVTLDTIQIGQPPVVPALPLQPPVNLDGRLHLLGATWYATGGELDGELGERIDEPETYMLPPNATLTIRLFWQALAPMETNYTGFVHMIGPDGQLVAQDDHQPQYGFLPTSLWYQGQIVADDYTVTFPETAPPGTYQLVAGMYTLNDTGETTVSRLPLTQGNESIGDAVLLGTVGREE